MIVYGELLIIENMVIGAVLLSITGRICGGSNFTSNKTGRQTNRLYTMFRLALASAMCGIFSLVIFLDAKPPLMLLMEAFFALAVCLVAFGKEQRDKTAGCSGRRMLLLIPWRRSLVFVLVTYFMGGITMGLLLVTRHRGIYTAVGIYTGDMKAAMLALFIWLGYMTAIQVIKTVRKRKLYTEHSYEVRIVCMGAGITAKAFLDTGNRLKEPLSGRPVAIASEDLWEKMQSCGALHEERFSLVPYETVGSKGVLEAIRTDYIDIGGRRIKGSFIARKSGHFLIGNGMKRRSMQASAGYDLIIPAEMADIGIE